MTYFVTTGHPMGRYRYSVPTGYSRYGSYSSKLADPLKGYTSSYSSYRSPVVGKSSYSSSYVPRSSYATPYVSRYSSYTPTTSYTPSSYSRPSYLTSSKLWSTSRKPSTTYSEPRSAYSRTLKPLSSTTDHDYSYLKKSAPLELLKYPKSTYTPSNYDSNRHLVRPKLMPLSDVSFKCTLSRYRGHLADYLSWR